MSHLLFSLTFIPDFKKVLVPSLCYLSSITKDLGEISNIPIMMTVQNCQSWNQHHQIMFSLWVKDLNNSYWNSITKHASIFYNISFQNFVPFETFSSQFETTKKCIFLQSAHVAIPRPTKDDRILPTWKVERKKTSRSPISFRFVWLKCWLFLEVV